MAPSDPLLYKLLECAKAIEGADLNRADSLLKDILTANETEAATLKLVKYFAEALVRRVYKLYPRNPWPLVPSCTDLRAYLDYQFYPFFWFSQMLTQQAFMDALNGKKRVHLIDFSFMLSSWRCQYLMEELARHYGAPKSFRLTTIGPMPSRHDSFDEIISKLVVEKARNLRIDFEKRACVANCPSDVVESTLKLKRTSEDEAIIVKWDFELHKLLALPGAIEKVLSKLKDLKPEVMVIAEQEATHNGLNFSDWFTKSFQYYSIVFESLEKDVFKDTNHCKVLWDMYFRRQIGNMAAQGGDHIERHESLAEWRNRLCLAGFRPVRLLFKDFKRTLFDDLPQYMIEEKNLHPQLSRYHQPLASFSIWKPDPTPLNGEPVENPNWEAMEVDGSSIPQPIAESETVDQSDDSDHIMMEGTRWSTECFSINQIAASAEIFDMLEYVCHVHYLPLALTWISDRRVGNTNSKGKQVLHIENTACYMNDFTMKTFVEACGENQLEEGQGVAGKALLSNSMYFESDVSKLKVDDYPFVCNVWEFGLHAVVAIKLANMYMSSVDYVLEIFLPQMVREIAAQKHLIKGILSILKKNCGNSWEICGEKLGGGDIGFEVGIEEVGTSNEPPADASGSSPPVPTLSDIGSLNTNDRIMAWNMVIADGTGIDGPQPHEQEVGEQHSTFRAAAPCPDNEDVGIDSSQLNASTTNKRRRTSEVWQYFDEVRENGEVWAKCKSCSTRYRGESTRGTTNLRKHLRSCPGKK